MSHGAKEAGGYLTGINLELWHGSDWSFAPEFFDEYYAKGTFSERKQHMKDISCAFVVAPGGIGTMDELWDVVCDLNCHDAKKPVIIMDLDGFWSEAIRPALEQFRKYSLLHKEIDNLHWANDHVEAVDIIEKYC